MSEEDRQGYLQQRAELQEMVTELIAEIHRLDVILRPVLAEEERAKDAIRRTMPFKLSDGARRKPAYDALLAISVKWGKTRNERRELSQRVRAYERKIESLNKLLDKEAKRRGKQTAA
jgi:hypothetical protein